MISLAHMTRPKYIPYQEDFINVTNHKETIVISIHSSSENNYRYKFQSKDPGVYTLAIYTTALNTFLKNGEIPNDIIINQKGEEIKSIYYLSHGSSEDILLYGMDLYPGGGGMTLPSLLLVSCMKFAVVTAIMIAILILVLKKGNQIREYLQKIILFPTAWLVSQFLITGYDAASYTILHDFCAILLLSIVLFLVLVSLSINKRKNASPSG